MIKEIKKLSADQLKDKIEKNPDLIVINVIGRDTYEDCKIKNSINIPFEFLERDAKKWDKNREIVVYCFDYDCCSDLNVFEFLDKMGFKNVWGYEDGMSKWHEKGYPLIKKE